jgi:DNA-binding beta-propeller fold protein YncE
MLSKKTFGAPKVGALLFALVLLLGTFSFANAWPDLPPTKAFISGPGLSGQVQITDSNLLTSLRLGGLEDFSKGALAAPKVRGDPYKIIRYFENGTFQMGDLSYYPAANGTASVVYFQDGPMKNGDRSPHNNQWYATIASSEQLLQQFIDTQSGANIASNTNATQAVWLARNVGAARQTIAFDATTNAPRFILPNGLRSADGKAYWAAFHSSGTTALHSFDVTNGAIRASLGLEGDWELGAVSATGKWLALKRTASETDQAAWNKTNTWKTTLALIDAATLKTTRTLSLNGNFDVDALDEARGLFLIEHLPAVKPDHYQVRVYDFGLSKLQDGALVDKRDINEVMAGYPMDAVASPDGRWLFTLYANMREGHAFVHALNLKEGYAWCIDLPSGDGSETTQQHYSLALAPDGHTIYASNALLGTIAIADMLKIGEPRVVRFTAAIDTANKIEPPMRASIVSPDGKHIFMSDGRAVWQYEVATNKVQELKRSTMPIIGLSLNNDSSALRLARADHSVSTLPLNTSNAQAVGSTSQYFQDKCPATLAVNRTFVAPIPYPEKAPYGQFWYGNEKLWTALQPDGKWLQLRYGEKVFWWSQGYVGTKEPQPKLKITAKRLDSDNPPIVLSEQATNAFHQDFGGWAMLSGVQLPEQGCWEIIGEYSGEKLAFVVNVTP